MDVDAAIERLDAALRGAGLHGLRPPDHPAILDEIEAAIAPLAMPPELRRTWQRADLGRLEARPFPEPTPPDFGLSTWRSHAETPGQVPAVLFPFAYSGHAFLFVELASQHRRGGPLFEWEYGPFVLRFLDVTDWIDATAEAVEAGAFRWSDPSYGGAAMIDDDVHRELAKRRLGRAHPIYGLGAEIPARPLGWPAHWLHASGITYEDTLPRGADHTVADLQAAFDDGGERGIVQAEVHRLGGSSIGEQALIGDGTGTMTVWCPAAVSTFGPVLGRRFEFELVRAQPEPEAPPADLRARLPGALSFASRPADAVAVAIRPLDV